MDSTLSTQPHVSGRRRSYLVILIALVLLFSGLLIFTNEPSQKFPVASYITIKPGEPLSVVANDLKSKNLVRSSILFKSIIVLLAGEQKLVAGDYYFSQPISTYSIVSRLMSGRFDVSSIKITIPEGYTMKQIGTLLAAKLSHFSLDEFMKYYPAKEGYLFPDTYFFAFDLDTVGVINLFQKNFDEKIKIVTPAIDVSDHTEKDILTMASILEDEARTKEDWQMISSILWKRIKIGMPLQVDSTLGYITGRKSSELTLTDLKMNSPYNTYTNKGLPPTPINNPGLETITAAATPTSTPYLYYLSDQKGDIHYAATFAEHIKNRQKYLK